MRESLTIFAIAVILVLSALLIGPYFVDWGSQREWLAAKLSDAIGARIRIDGPIDVKLLPRPIFRAGRVSIGGGSPHDSQFAADRLDAELSINGLLQGAVEFVDARLSSPRITVTVRRDGTLAASPLGVASPQKIQFRNLAIEDGTLAVLDENGTEKLVLHGVSADGEAETLFGPLKLSGSVDGDQGRMTFRLTTGTYSNGRLRTRLVIDRKGGLTHAEVEGQIAIASSGPATAPGAALSFAGNLALAGELRVAEAASAVPWSLTAAAITAEPRNLAAPAVELRAGADGRALVANGGVLLSLGDTAAVVAKLHGRQLDLDRLAVPPDVAPDTPRPSPAQWLAAARRLLEGGPPLGLRLTVEAGVDAVTTGDLTFTDAEAGLDAQPGKTPRITASIAGPDGSRIAVDGALETGAAPAYKGLADLATRNASTAAAWLDPFWPGASDWVNRGIGSRSVALKGNVDLSAVGISARDTTVSLGGTVLSGTLSLTAPVGDERARLFADLAAEAVDPEQWPDLHQLTALAEPLDLSLALRSDAVRLPRAEGAPAQTARLSLHAIKTDKVFALDRFEASGLGGTSVTGSALLDADRHLHAQGEVAARDVAALAALARQITPGFFTDALAAHAAALAPLAVGFEAEAVVDDGGGMVPVRMSGHGTAGATRFAGSISPELRGGNGSDVDATLTIDAPEAGQVLNQFGWHAAAQFGTFHADLHARGSLAAGLDSSISATVPGAKLAFDGNLGAGTGQGRFTAGGDDVVPWLRFAGLSSQPADRSWAVAGDLSWDGDVVRAHTLTARLGGSAITGDLDYRRPAPEDAAMAAIKGNLSVDSAPVSTLIALSFGQPPPVSGSLWSSQPFPTAPSLPATDVGLKIGSLGIWPGVVVRDAALQLSLKPGVLTLADMSGHMLGGTAGGTVTLRRNGSAGSLSGRLSFDTLSVKLPSLSGQLSGTLNLVGTGSSPAALVSSLGGDGTLSLAAATVPRLDPAALGRVAADFNAEGATIEDGPVRDALGKALDRADFSIGAVSAPATVAAGVLRTAVPKTAQAGAAYSADAALDVEDLTLTMKITLAAAELPRDWKGDPPQLTATWKGLLAAPVRDIDAGSFVNGLAARAIAREQERIELMKDDLRERAFFARRLKQIEAEQQAARDAAQAQKAVPQPPQRPSDIRLPKPPEVPPVTVPAPPKASENDANEDAISKFLKALTPDNPKPGPPAKPMELSPQTRPAAQATPAPATQDPGSKRY